MLEAVAFSSAILLIVYARRRKIPTVSHAIAFFPWLICGLVYAVVMDVLVAQNGFKDLTPSHQLAWWAAATRVFGPLNLIVCLWWLIRRWKA
jgi:uncharacterized membrane protein YkvI